MRPPATANLVVIGGGVIGASAAWHLAEAGVERVVLVERATLASGSTSKAAGGIRMQFSDATNVALMQRSVPVYEQFEERYEVDIGLCQPGYLILFTPQDEPAFDRALDLQRTLGVGTERLTVSEVARRIPHLVTDGLAGANFNQRDGYATPESVVQGYAQAAHALGVTIVQGCEVLGIVAPNGRIQAVQTTEGVIATDAVVCAAGVGSARIGTMVGLEIPVRAEPRWLHYSPGDCGLPADLPLTIDFETGFYVHREGPGLLVGGRESPLAELAHTAVERLPCLEEMRVQSSWWGDYEMSPDHNAIVGAAEEPASFYYATGFSGHGFQQAPAIGEHLAELVLGRAPTIDLQPLSLARFGAGDEHAEQFII